MYARRDVDLVRQLRDVGLSKAEIARQAGVSRTTVRSWLDGRYPGWQADLGLGGRQGGCFRCDAEEPSRRAYAYLFGQYLGDGSITTRRNGVHRLVITTDAKYPEIIRECVRALEDVIPTSRVGVQRHGDAECFNVLAYSKHIVCMFPQHGPGRKHERRIRLAPWQREIVFEHPQALIRGLIHSDGCRFLNRVKRPVGGEMRGYTYPRYMFSNNSPDIQLIFTDALDQLGIAWRNTRWNCISVARRVDVARLDAFVGPKC